MLSVLAKDLSVNDKAELLMCILEYPNRDSELVLWKYIKHQIDLDAQKYKEKCERMAANAKSRWTIKPNSKTDPISDVRVSSNENKIKDNCNVKVSSNAGAPVENSVDKYLISNIFSFTWLCSKSQPFANHIACYPKTLINRAEKTLKEKCAGQILTMPTIIKWIQQESIFFNHNNGGLL